MKNETIKLLIVVISLGTYLASCSFEDPEYPVYLDLSTEVRTVSFEPIVIGQSGLESYRIAATKLEANVIISLENDNEFSISKSSSGNFSDQIEFTPEELNGNLATVYVQFNPESIGTFSGTITHSTQGFVGTPRVSLSAQSISDPDDLPELLMMDNFNYPAGEIPSTPRTNDGAENSLMEGWIKVRTANEPIYLTTPALEYPGYPGSGIGRAVLIDFEPPGSNSNLYAYNLTEQQDEEFTGSYYAAFLIQVNANPAPGQFNRPVMFVDWLPNGPTDFTTAIQIINSDDDVKFGVLFGGEGVVTDITPVIGKTYLAVLKHTVTDTNPGNSTNTGALYLFEDGIPSAEPEEPDAFGINPLGDNRFIKAISLLNDNSAAGSYVIDGLRVAHTWEDLFK